jgi:hypothetical protein
VTHSFEDALVEVLGKAIGERFGHDGAVVVCSELECGTKFLRAALRVSSV